ncbi:outer membrane protein [Flavobacterium sp.]|uniref:outer membrane protein n=1 Tax=Flavobacterium sp. TaxID=239 RepID=UPI0035B068C4
MKKLIVSAVLLMGLGFTAQAQEISKNALGLRLGDNNGFGAEISYQKGLSKNNRLEADLGWRNNRDVSAFKLTGIYQWVWEIDNNFNWYAGAGAGLGNWSTTGNNGSFVYVAGDVGIEYNFKEAPILLSLDYRPEFGGHGYFDNNYGADIALGIRYKF